MASEREDGQAASQLDAERPAPLTPDTEARPAPQRRAPMRARPVVLVVIAAGGALGASARYGMAQVLGAAPGSFPWATFWTNVSGSLLLGTVMVLIVERFPPSRFLRPFLATGFLGAYTTYSTFAVETDVLVKVGHTATALAYVAASLVAGLAAVAVGMLVARLLPLTRRGGRP